MTGSSSRVGYVQPMKRAHTGADSWSFPLSVILLLISCGGPGTRVEESESDPLDETSDPVEATRDEPAVDEAAVDETADVACEAPAFWTEVGPTTTYVHEFEVDNPANGASGSVGPTSWERSGLSVHAYTRERVLGARLYHEGELVSTNDAEGCAFEGLRPGFCEQRVGGRAGPGLWRLELESIDGGRHRVCVRIATHFNEPH